MSSVYTSAHTLVAEVIQKGQPMSLKLRYDFWHVESSKGNASVIVSNFIESCTKVLSAEETTPTEDELLLLPRSNKHVRLQKLEKRGFLWLGDFVGIGTKRAAKKANTKGLMEDIPFKDNEGLGEENAFLLDPATNVLVLQSNRLAATSAAVVQFLQRFGVGIGDVDLLPILTPSSMQRLGELKRISSFKVGIARMNFGPTLQGKHSVSSLVDIAQDLSGPRIDLEVSVGHAWRKQGLDFDKVVRAVQDLFGAKDRRDLELLKAEVTGRTEEDDLDVLDLTTGRLKETVSVEPDEGRGVSRLMRWQEAYAAYQRHEVFLREQFGKQI